MAVQFAGSGSTGSRRRRRLVANGDDPGVDASLLEGDGEITSQLIASEAAAPWVPATELRIWIYTALTAVMTGGLILPLFYQLPVPTALKPVKEQLFTGSSPKLIVVATVMFLGLSTQLALLIGWYRSRCRLDFSGRYRVWPWAVGLFAIVTLGLATNLHHAIGQIAINGNWFAWRGSSLGWLVPIGVAALPVAYLLDRDLRHSRSSLWLFRCSALLWLAATGLEVFQPEMKSQAWFEVSFLLLPLVASSTLFLSLWHHARIVAYVCPDPPELDESTIWSRLSAAIRRIGGLLMFWKRKDNGDDAKPKRRRKKADGEEVVAKRKRKSPARRRTSRTKTRPESVDEDAESEDNEATSEEESEDVDESSAESTSWVESDEESGDEYEDSRSANSRGSQTDDRNSYIHKSHGSSVPAPHSRRPSPSSWEDEEQSGGDASASQSDESDDENDDERQFPNMADQMRGMSKRQRRELRKQLRDQERSRGR